MTTYSLSTGFHPDIVPIPVNREILSIPEYLSLSKWIEKVKIYLTEVYVTRLADRYCIEYSNSPSIYRNVVEDSFQVLVQNLQVKVLHQKSVIDYLIQNEGFDLAVLYASLRIRETFGNSAEVVLDIDEDAESSTLLEITVRKREYCENDDILTVLDTISLEYESDFLESDGWLVLTTDFHYAQ